MDKNPFFAMNSSPHSSFLHRTRGSAFITVIIFTAMMALILGTLMTWSINERHLNGRNLYWLQASNAAEALAEYGMSQVANLFDNNPAPAITYFDPAGTTPLTLPNWVNATNTATGNSFFAPNGSTKESYIDTHALSTAHPYGLELIATPPAFFGADTGAGTDTVLIDSGGNDDLNSATGNSVHDIENGKYVRRRDIQILAKATAVPTDGTSPITVCVQETISVRGDPLFSNAIFYSNNDLELFPSKQMDVYGPVRVNGNLFVSSQSSTGGVSLNFHGSVFASGNIYHAWDSQAHAGDGKGNEALGSNPVDIENQANTAVNLKSAGGTWDDSTMGADQALMSGGLYTDTSTALLSYNTATPPAPTGQLNTLIAANNTAFLNYLESTFGGLVQTGPTYNVQSYNPVGYTAPIDSSGDLPSPHSIIDPPSPPATSDAYYTAKETVESGKLANKAGLYVQVTITPGVSGAADTATINFYGPPGTGTGASTDGPNKLTGTGGVFLGGYSVNASGVATAISGGGTEPPSLVKFVPYKTSTTAGVTSVTSGIYDHRQQTGVDLVQLDMSALNAALTDINASSTADNKAIVTSGNALWGYGANGWNGAIYVDVNQPTGNQAAVAVVNGGVAAPSTAGMLPTTNAGLAGGAVSGLTIATAAPLYIVGDFNTDGKNAATASSATTPEDGGTDTPSNPSKEIPVALAADAITILSTTFFGTDATTTNHGALPSATVAGSEAYVNAKDPAPGNDPIPNTDSVSVAAAFLTGIVSTTTSASSGGAHNLPRFLESWLGGTVNIRGSLVSLFSSTVATKPYDNSVYGAPDRNWGFDVILKNGHYPPQTPNTITFRRVFSNVISPITYKSLRTAAATTPTGGSGASGGGYPSDSFVNF
jgi:hypothetical protein